MLGKAVIHEMELAGGLKRTVDEEVGGYGMKFVKKLHAT
jgi:hypothetical protein